LGLQYELDEKERIIEKMNGLEGENLRLKKRIIKFEDFAQKVGELDSQNTTLENCVKKLSDEVGDGKDKNYELFQKVKAKDLEVMRLRENLNCAKNSNGRLSKDFME
jgi:predicted nuclease with TOPRIM domain